jgi:Acyl-CoA carboxylase epsilon subunit
MPLRLVRGDASPEEIAALIAVLAAASRGGDGEPGQGHRSALTTGRHAQSQWNLPERMVRAAHPHGPKGWRASALPR